MGHAARREAQLVQIAGAQLDRRADPEGVVLPAPLAQRDEAHIHVLVHVAAVVAEHAGPSVPAGDDQVQVAVLVDVGDDDGAAGPQVGGQDGGEVLEAPRRIVAEQAHPALPHDDQIEATVVVEIEERGVQTGDPGERAPQKVRPGVALERPVPPVVVQRGIGAVERGEKQVQKSVVVVVADRHRAGPPHGGEAARRRHVLEASLAQVAEEPCAPVAADDQEIAVAVAVEIAELRVAAALHGQAHLGGHLAKRAVQVVAVDTIPGGRREEEIEIAVMVEIGEQHLPRGSRLGQACGRDVAKPAPTRILEQDSPPRGRHVEVQPSVVVEIAERRRDGPIPKR